MVLDSGGVGVFCSHPQHDRRLAQSYLQEDQRRGVLAFIFLCHPVVFSSFCLFFFFFVQTCSPFAPSVLCSLFLSVQWCTSYVYHLVTESLNCPCLNFCPLLNVIAMIWLFSNPIDCLQSKHINTVLVHYRDHFQRKNVFGWCVM